MNYLGEVGKSMGKKIQVHQIHPSVSYGDAIGNDMVEIQNLLRKMGYDSNIYAKYIHPKMNEVKNYTEYLKVSSRENILLIHYSIGYGEELLSFIESLPDKKILIYHNITPSHFFKDINSDYEYFTKVGREELKQFRDIVDLALADSEYNREELNEVGFKITGVLPIIIDFEKYDKIADDKLLRRYDDDYVNILFVGRVSPNKKFEDIIKSFYYYQHINSKSRLFLVGSGEGMDRYRNYLDNLVKELKIKNVYFTGHVSFEELVAYFKLADIFLVMSEHEGFCVPLLESMFFEIPIMAYKSTAIPDTLGDSGILVQEKNYAEIAEMIDLLVGSSELKTKIINRQKERLKYYNKDKIGIMLRSYLEMIAENKKSKPSIRIEGTFEDSYSLSIVNRNLALALDALGENVSIYATTGSGDYTPKEGSINDEKVKSLWEKRILNPYFVIRNIYPPRITDMKGKYNLINFAWEESLIPNQWVGDFNRLDGIMVPSNFVKNVLINSGVTSKIEVIPNIIDIGLFTREVKPMESYTRKGFVFLNIGSGFPRKGVDVLIRAYTEEFTSDDDVSLILKSFPNIHNNIQELIKAATKSNGPEIIHIEEDMSEDEIISLYKASNCFVSPTRGEGFGLPMAEAMLCKIPVIVTNYGGHLDFCSKDNSYLIDFELTLSRTHLKAEYGIKGSMWAEPDTKHLKRLMRYVYENKDSLEVKDKTEAAYNNIITNFNRETSAKRTINFLNKISSKTKLGMVSTWNTKCGIAEYTRYIIEGLPNDIEVTVFSNHVDLKELIREDEGNVIRCWNAYFDDLDQLYRNIIKENLNKIHFQFNFGLFELNALISLINKLRLKGVKTIITFHSVDDTEAFGKEISLRDFKEDLKLVESIWVHTSDDREKLLSIGLDDNVIQIPQGNKVYPDTDKNLIRSNIFSNSKIISTFGFFLPHKGILETIRALPKLVEIWPDILFLVISALYPNSISAEYYTKCKQEAERLKLNKNVIFMKNFLDEEECIELLQASDMVVMPYKETKESSSAAVRFALASHRPVMVTDLPIFKEFNDEVYKIQNSSPDAIADGIIKLYGSKDQRDQIIASSEKLIELNSWENIVNIYNEKILKAIEIVKSKDMIGIREHKDPVKLSNNYSIQIDHTKRYFEEVARRGELAEIERINHLRYKIFIDLLIKYNAQGKICDIGCNYANVWYEYLRNLGLEYYCVDLNPDVIDYMKKLLSKSNVNENDRARIGRLEDIPFNNNFFDIVYAGHIIEHTTRPEKAFSEIKRVMKDDGLLIFVVPCGYDEEPAHTYNRDKQEWLNDLEEHGFIVHEYKQHNDKYIADRMLNELWGIASKKS